MVVQRVLLSVFAVLITTVVQADDVSGEERENAFSERMAKTALIGAFTFDGQNLDEAPKAERYEIASVVKAAGNQWIFTARVKYLNFDTTLPITVPVEWAGDTPIVTLTNASLPGLGDGFSCRVLFHDDRYAGTWQHGAIGGHMFGRIVKQAAQQEEEKTSE